MQMTFLEMIHCTNAHKILPKAGLFIIRTECFHEFPNPFVMTVATLQRGMQIFVKVNRKILKALPSRQIAQQLHF